MMSNRFIFGNGGSVPYSYMISIAEALQQEGCLVRGVWEDNSIIVFGMSFSWRDCDEESIKLHQLRDGDIVIYFDENIDITMAFNMFVKIRDGVGM